MRLKEIIEKINIHSVFKLTVLAKGIDGVLEVIGGFLLLSMNPTRIINIIRLLTQHELSEDPKDLVVNYFIREISKLSLSGQIFGSFYLLSHGIIKIFLVISLLQRRLWAYPTAIIFFTAFMLYQIYRYQYTHSLLLVFLTILDFFVIILTLLEYRNLRAHIQTPNHIG